MSIFINEKLYPHVTSLYRIPEYYLAVSISGENVGFELVPTYVTIIDEKFVINDIISSNLPDISDHPWIPIFDVLIKNIFLFQNRHLFMVFPSTELLT